MPETTSDYIKSTSKEYALYVAGHRAIPSVTDGLKDSQRIALWLARNKPKMKVSGLNGEMAGSNLYVHGDASGTISLLAAPFLNNVPFLTGHGGFGTRLNPYAMSAPRYVSVEKSKAADNILYQDMNLIPMIENYDGSSHMPETFLPLIPTVLLNGISGIAVGWSTDVLPHSLKDIVKATIEAIDGKKITKLKPDYSYLNCSVSEIEDNVWKISGKVEFVDSSTVRIIEIPPESSLEDLHKRLDWLEDRGKIKDYIDNSKKTIDVLVKLPRGSVKQEEVQSYIDLFGLNARKTERIVVIDFNHRSIKQYASPEEVVQAFVQWRFGYYINRYEELLKASQYDLLFWETVKACFDDELPRGLHNLQNKKEVLELIEECAKNHDLSPDDSIKERIANFPTYRWTKDEYQNCLNKIADIEKDIANYSDLLANPDKIKTIFKNEVKQLEKLA